MSTSLMPSPLQRFYTNAGAPAAGYLLFTYEAGTSTLKQTFTDADGLVPHTNPIVLNAKGEAVIYWTGNYKVELKSPLSVTVTGFPVDNFEAPLMPASLAADEGSGMVGFQYGESYSSGTIGRWLQDLSETPGASLIGTVQNLAGAVGRTVESKARDIVSVKDFGAVGDGVENDTAAFTAARNASANGKYLIPPGDYLVDASPNVWADSFTAPHAGTTLTIGVDTFDVSGSFGSGWCNDSNTERYLTWKHARTGATIAIWSDGESSGDSHRLFLPWDMRRNSHYMIAAPGTDGGSCDMLWRRSDANADPRGNRFNQTFEESPDRMLYSFATTASGSPSFDAYMRCYAGTSAKLDFPALAPCFRQGWTLQNRAETGYKLAWVVGTDRHHIQDVALTFTHMTFKEDGAVGFFGAGGNTRQTVTGSRGGNAALASLLTALSSMGLISDGTTA